MKKLVLVIMFTLCGTLVFAQWGEEQLSDKPDWKERIFTGGGIGGSFGSYYDYISVSPLVGYRITQKLAGGVQFQYRYTHYKTYTPDFSTNDFGVSPFLRFSIFGPLFLHAEYEYLSYQYPISAQGDKARKGFNSFMAGGGFFQPVGRHAGIYAVALYNFSYKDPTSSDFYPYNSPWILRVGITAGF
ncbi:MAG TPA: hypothetical protein VK589_31250 [Chryseolinea sp.]|nr:hypothetical protein [Chryseolinea sp.]